MLGTMLHNKIHQHYSLFYSPAQSVVLNDESFLPEEFSVEQGLLAASWERIPQYPPLLQLHLAVCYMYCSS